MEEYLPSFLCSERMSNSIVLRSSITTIGTLEGNLVLRTPVKMPSNGQVKIQCSSMQVSNRIPNIYNGAVLGLNFNNTMLRVGTDLQPYQLIALDNGVYASGPIIMAAVNAAINTLGWWMNPKDPGLSISLNDVIGKFVIVIDSSKLNPAFGSQFRFDLQEATTGSTLYKTLGFLSTTLLVADGLYTSPNAPVMATQGTTAVVVSSLMPPRRYNEDYKALVADVAIAYSVIPNDLIWPPGGVISTVLIYSGPRTITQATFNVLTTDGAPMVFLSGQLIIELAFYW